MSSLEMAVDIGTLISRSPDIKGGSLILAGTGVTVKRIAGWHRLGMMPEEIAVQYGHLTLAQVHAALAYYYMHRAEIDADLAEELAEYDHLSEQAKKGKPA